jgi:stalled ribosome rescue protein Dom34
LKVKNYKRGYPVAILISLEQNQAVIWKIFSHAAKQEPTISIDDGKADTKALYNFFESIVNALRPTLKEGVKSIIIASPPRTGYGLNLLSHNSRFSKHANTNSQLDKHSRL